MLVKTSIKVLLLLLGGVFIVLQGLGFEYEGTAVSTFMLLLLTFLYCNWTKEKSICFFWFLILFTLAQCLGFSSYFWPEINPEGIDYFYFASNAVYIVSYVSLILKVTTQLNLKTILSQFYVPIIILLILDIFCVVLVTATTEEVLTIYEYSLEFVYNAIIMTLLSVVLINYMYRNDNKSMLLLLGSILVVFSEIIQLAYYYILEVNYLGFIYSAFLVGAFIFFYLQSQQSFTGPVPAYSEDQIKA